MLQRLKYLRLSSNKLTGTIPTELGHLGLSEELILNHNMLIGSLPKEVILSFTDVKAMGLANNSLTGTIPTELGLLTNANYLRLEENELRGSIPSELGAMTNIRSMILTENKVSQIFVWVQVVDIHPSGQ